MSNVGKGGNYVCESGLCSGLWASPSLPQSCGIPTRSLRSGTERRIPSARPLPCCLHARRTARGPSVLESVGDGTARRQGAPLKEFTRVPGTCERERRSRS